MMKKSYFVFIVVIALGLVLTACSDSNGNSGTNNNAPSNTNTSGNDEDQVATTLTTKEMVDGMLARIEQPKLMEMNADLLKEMYYIDPTSLEQYTVMHPLMNVKTNEVAIFKVQDAKHIVAVQEGIEKRAADIQRNFETYLQDQYENAKNYRLVTKGNYILFVIADAADVEKFVTEFETFFEQK